MRAAEFIVETIIHTVDVDGLTVKVDSHLRDRAQERAIPYKSIAYALIKLGRLKKKLKSVEPGGSFWFNDPENNLSLGIRKLSVDNKVYLLKTVIPGEQKWQGRYPVITAPTNLDEGWREKAAAAMTAATLAYGGYNQLNKPNAVNPPAASQAVPTKKPFVLKFADKNPVRDYLVQRGRQAGFSDIELAHLVSQVQHETMDFKHMEEIGTPKYFARKYDKKYNPRKAKILGNVKVGDGERYKGRGFVHLTGRDNYTRAGQTLGIDLANNPQLAADPKIAADIAVWFWKNRVQPKVDDFPAATVAQVTKPINPGLKGLQDREAKFQKIANR